MAELRGNEIIAEYLVKQKVPYLIGYAGHGAIGMLDGIYDRTDKIKIVFPRIEQAAGFMADAYFRVTGFPLPVYVSTGPGPMQLTIAIARGISILPRRLPVRH
jgi:acetolactate synthase-1/2/3 large subunit